MKKNLLFLLAIFSFVSLTYEEIRGLEDPQFEETKDGFLINFLRKKLQNFCFMFPDFFNYNFIDFRTSKMAENDLD